VSLATPAKLRRLQEALYTKAKQEPAYRFYLLYDKVYRADLLAHAYALSRQHGGAPGVDGVTFEDIEGAGWSHGWPQCRRRCELRRTARKRCGGC
jgi:RNA-directed DNA polymerase